MPKHTLFPLSCFEDPEFLKTTRPRQSGETPKTIWELRQFGIVNLEVHGAYQAHTDVAMDGLPPGRDYWMVKFRVSYKPTGKKMIETCPTVTTELLRTQENQLFCICDILPKIGPIYVYLPTSN